VELSTRILAPKCQCQFIMQWEHVPRQITTMCDHSRNTVRSHSCENILSIQSDWVCSGRDLSNKFCSHIIIRKTVFYSTTKTSIMAASIPFYSSYRWEITVDQKRVMIQESSRCIVTIQPPAIKKPVANIWTRRFDAPSRFNLFGAVFTDHLVHDVFQSRIEAVCNSPQT
jgi:hypothetical protein